MRLKLLLLTLLLGIVVRAQIVRPWESYLNQVMMVEDLASDSWQQTYDLLCDLEQHPLNINTTTREELEKLPFLSDQQVEALMAYQYHYGGMKSVAELQMIPEINEQTRQLLQFFIYIGDVAQQDKRVRHELTALVNIPIDAQNENHNYLGSSYKHWFRYQMAVGDYMKLGLVGAQDKGEPFFSHGNRYGYDYYSPYFEWRKRGRLETLVLGNYRVSMGMGMVMNNSFSLGKIAMLQNLGRSTHMLRAHSSKSEGFLQGAGVTVRLGKGWRATAFVSYAPMDATLNSDGTARTIVTTGYHRTVSEMDRKHNLHALKTGGALRYEVGRLHLGLNGLYVHLDRRLKPSKTQLYSYYKPEGPNFVNASLDYGYRGRRWALNGETAVDGHGHIATINTLSLAINNGLSVLALQRFYSYQYESLDAQSYSDGGKVQNESGGYLGLQWQPTPKWQMTAYVDYAYYPWPRYRETASSDAMDYLLQGIYTTRKWKMMARYRWKTREKVQRMRLSAEYATTVFSAKTQIDGNYGGTAESTYGVMVSENVAYTYKWLRVNGGVGYFNAETSDNRLYLYELGPLYTYSIQQFYSKGMRYWLMLRGNLGRRLGLTAKMSMTDYNDRYTQTALDLQLRYIF